MNQQCQNQRCLCSVVARSACERPVRHGDVVRYCTKPAGHTGDHYSCGNGTWKR